MGVAFNDWSEAVFKKAEGARKPILLFLTVNWSGDGQLMLRETYEDAKIVPFVNENFIAVRVDAEKRPDINRRYNQGGLPSTVFLDPSGQILTGAAHLPAKDFGGMARGVLSIYRELIIKGAISRILEKNRQEERDVRLQFETKKSVFEADWTNFLVRFEREAKEQFDPLYGGFGTAAKLPQTDTLTFCLRRFLKSNDGHLVHIVRRSLESYCEAGLFDHLDGGFFRAASNRRFESPFSEKLLGDNLRLARLYFEAGNKLGEERFVAVARKTLEFIRQWLYEDPFYLSSLEAKPEYYAIISRQARREAAKPPADETIFTDLNVLAALNLFDLGQDKGAKDLLRCLFADFRTERGFFRHFLGEGVPGSFLGDQVFPLAALLRFFPDESKFAADFLRFLLVNFYDEENGGFFDRLREEEHGLLKERYKPLEENLILISLLKRFGYTERAEKSLIEIFNLYREPILLHAPLAVFLDDSS